MSLSDFISSSKGPGFIGFLLAAAVLGGFVILGTLTLDDRFQGGGATTQGLIDQDAQTIHQLHEQLDVLEGRVRDNAGLEQAAQSFDDLKTGIQLAQGSLANNQALLASTREGNVAIKNDLEAYKNRYRSVVREAAAGTELESFTTLDGITYHKVRINRIGDVGMNITHSDGSARIPFAKLPQAMQDFYQFDAQNAKKAIMAETDVSEQHVMANAEALQAEQAKRGTKQREADFAAKVEREKNAAELSQKIRDYSTEINELEMAITRESYKSISRAPQMREQLTAMKQAKRDLESRLQSIRSKP